MQAGIKSNNVEMSRTGKTPQGTHGHVTNHFTWPSETPPPDPVLRTGARRTRRQGWRWREAWEARGADFDASGGGARRRFEVGGVRVQNIENNF
jgi:hypothetical protein